jgi:hypothetical protein
MIHSTNDVLNRIRNMSEKRGNCLVFLGSCDKDGYGWIKHNYVTYKVHRLVYILTYGPTELDVLHSCDNPPCWLLEHLKVGTALDNAQDRDSKGRGAIGSKHPNAKLTEQQVLSIREEYKPYFMPQRILAEKYGVSTSMISCIITGANWSHVKC